MTQPVKSAIKEVRDQLFLDRADGRFLSELSTNLNFDRPIHGWGNDDLWRAIVKRAALDYRQIANVFRDLLTIILGPNKTKITTLINNALATENQITIVDPSNIPQLGTLVIDGAMASAQTIPYTFRDLNNGLVNLKYPITASHTAVGYNATDRLAVNHASTATNLVLISSGLFPAGGWPYTIIVGRGTVNEEVVELIWNTAATNTLTISVPGLVNNHDGMQPTPIVSQLTRVESAATVIYIGDSSQFPDEGVVQIVQDDGLGTTAEDVVFKENDLDNNKLTLNRALTNTYSFSAPETSVTLLKDGSLVEMAQVQVKRVEWGVFETEPGLLQIYIPDIHNPMRLQDAWYLHGDDPGTSPSTVVVGNHVAGERSLPTTVAGGLDGFPTAGVARIDSGNPNEEYILYHRQDTGVFTRMLPSHPTRGVLPPAAPTAGIPINTIDLYVDDVSALIEWELFNTSKTLTLARNDLPNIETVTYTSIDPVTNKITLASPGTLKAHVPEDHVHPGNPDVMYFARPLENPHNAGETISLFKTVYGATLLEDGTIFGGDHQFQGSYLSEFALEAVRDRDINADPMGNFETTLSENVAGPTQVLVYQKSNRTSIEVKDASLLGTTFNLRIGRGNGTDEDVDVAAIFLRRDIKGSTITVNAPSIVGDTTISLSDTTILPTAWGYRLLFDRGGANEEVAIVKGISVSGLPGTIILEDPLTKPHAAVENAELMGDVIEINGTLEYDHTGLIPHDQRLMPLPGPLNWSTPLDPVEELRTYINVVSAASFPSGEDQAIINFGAKEVAVESRIQDDTVIGSVALVLESSDNFPAAGYPYLVDVGVDTTEEEHLEVTNNVIGTETLTLSPLEFDHKGDPSTGIDSPGGEHVRYRPGKQELVIFTSVTTAPHRLVFDPPIILEDRHLKGEPVRLSGITSSPTGLGHEFPLYLPELWEDRLKYIFDRCRAAGVQIIVINSK